MRVKEIPIESIDVGKRRRIEFGDIEALAAGIDRVGLLEPILVDSNGESGRYRLVFGERRLRAVTILNWKTIPAQLREHLSEEEFRDLELEENDNRKALTEGERARTFQSSKRLVEKAKRAAEVSPRGAAKPQGGRPPKYGKSKDEIADDLAIGKDTLERAEQHVATAERYPFLQGKGWRQRHVLHVQDCLEKLPEEEHGPAMDVLSCAKLMDPALAVRLLGNLAVKPIADRQDIYELSTSADSRKRSLALTKIAELPPMPDPRLGALETAITALKRATEPFPEDPLTGRIQGVIQELRSIRAAVKEVNYDVRPKQGKAAIQ
jgi:hypothetical protein